MSTLTLKQVAEPDFVTKCLIHTVDASDPGKEVHMLLSLELLQAYMR